MNANNIQTAEDAYTYARDIIKGRFLEAEVNYHALQSLRPGFTLVVVVPSGPQRITLLFSNYSKLYHVLWGT